MRICLTTLLLLIALLSSSAAYSQTEQSPFVTPLGKSFEVPAPSDYFVELHQKAKADYEADPTLENVISYGRRTAYLGRYHEAIDIFSKGLEMYPDDMQLLRHRGHRYMSVRDYEPAYVDLNRAAELAKILPDIDEEGSMPNDPRHNYNSIHGNIWYHLGILHYIHHDFDKAHQAFLNFRNAKKNDEVYACTSNWLYMSLRRQGKDEEAQAILDALDPELKVHGNQPYLELCLFYKGIRDPNMFYDKETGAPTPQTTAIMYGLANWDLYNNDDKESAKKRLEKVLDQSAYVGFGYLAAENDYIRLFGHGGG